jgi:hypothetical protein
MLGVGLPRLQVREAKASRQGRSRAGLGRSRRLIPRDCARDGHALGRQLRLAIGKKVRAAVLAPLTSGAVGENSAADSARAHGAPAEKTHTHTVLGGETALPAVNIEVRAHRHQLGVLAPVLGRGGAAVVAYARGGEAAGGHPGDFLHEGGGEETALLTTPPYAPQLCARRMHFERIFSKKSTKSVHNFISRIEWPKKVPHTFCDMRYTTPKMPTCHTKVQHTFFAYRLGLKTPAATPPP